MDQISVRGMNFDQLKPASQSRVARPRKRRSRFGEYRFIQRRGSRVSRVKSQSTRRNRNPSAVRFRNLPCAFPRPLRASFASRMSELHPGNSALLANESRNARELSTCSSFQIPRSHGLIRPSGVTAARLREHQSRAAHRAAAQMHQVPIGRKSIRGRILAHRRNNNAIAKRTSRISAGRTGP